MMVSWPVRFNIWVNSVIRASWVDSLMQCPVSPERCHFDPDVSGEKFCIKIIKYLFSYLFPYLLTESDKRIILFQQSHFPRNGMIANLQTVEVKSAGDIRAFIIFPVP